MGSPEFGGAQLRQAREAAGYSLGEMAARVPYSKAALGHYETGVRSLTAEVITWYERVCGQFTDPVTTVVTLGRADVDRRAFLRKAVYSAALSATAIGVGTLDAAGIERLANLDDKRMVGMGEVQALRRVVEAFQHLDEFKGGGVGRTAVAELLSTDVATLLRSRFATSEVRAQAFSIAAELSYLAGFKAHDAGMDGAAQRYYLSALHLAEASGVPGHDAWVCRVLALQGNDIGKRVYGIDLAEEACRRACGKVDGGTQALFTVALARCHAEVGNKREALAALTIAEPWIAPGRSAELPAWCAWWGGDQATVNNQCAKTFRALGDYTAAEPHHQLATTMWEPGVHRRVYANTLGDVGIARWKTGDHTGAIKAWNMALPILSELQSARVEKTLGKIRRSAPELFTV
ncbi:helix-turn-helix domain-containing protein [Nocardia inohanensis]|uniref:helix-turn-helix domain-containing protein n=1 Tax=Nocardia inohanensis TaxID=209246 RepID=UPI00082D6DF7|nr:helix-turn-helix domain-containing protein [Nocardia inohanensis]